MMKSTGCQILLTFCLTFLTVWGINGRADAHKVTVFAWVEGNIVYTQSKFSGGKKPQNALVEVFDENNHKLLEGHTDKNGEFSFKAPKKATMKIVLNAGMGHKGQWTLPAEEFTEFEPSTESKSSAVQPSVEMPVKTSIPSESPPPASYLSQQQIELAMEKALDRKLGPIITKLNKSLDPDHGPTAADIFGGIGYIFGLVGVGTYFNYRKSAK